MNKCCKDQLKFYNFLTCRECWQCQICNLQGCDKIMYQNNPVPIKTKFLVEEFLTAHKRIDMKQEAKLEEETTRGLDIPIVIMKTKEKARVYMREPVNIYPYCDVKDIKLVVHKTDKHTNTWACDIGPIDKPVVATLTLDNQKIPLIVTN